MNSPPLPHTFAAPSGNRSPVFDAQARAAFGAAYPEEPLRLRHSLGAHPLLDPEALAVLGESLPASSVEHNSGDLPIGVDGKPAPTGLTIGQTIRQVAQGCHWAVLKNIEQVPAYRALLLDLLEELRSVIQPRTGRMLTPQGFIFISSPGAVTPYHFDPEHNILMQLAGSKRFTLFPAGDPELAPDQVHEAYHTGGPRELAWPEELAGRGTGWELAPGDALFVPVMAPHWVKVGPQPSVSLSITWRSDWSYAEADARAFNALLRRAGFAPRAPGRWPARNRPKALAWRILRKIGFAGRQEC